MSLVLVDFLSKPDLLAMAGRRWDAIRHTRPELAAAVDLQERLLSIVIDTAQTIGRLPLPKLSLPPRYLAAKLSRGVPILSGEPIPLPVRVLQASFLQLCDALAEGGAGEPAGHVKIAVESASMDAGSLLTASLGRDQQAVRNGAAHHGLAPDLVWLLGELATSPFAHTLQHALLASSTSDELVAARDSWNHGYCLACGSWPALAECCEGRRVLRCSFCAAGWELDSYSCIYCGEDGQPFVTAAPDEERKNRRLEICGTCAAYLKTIDVEELSPFPLVAIADMETMDLDLAAMEHGYARPALKEFKRRSS